MTFASLPAYFAVSSSKNDETHREAHGLVDDLPVRAAHVEGLEPLVRDRDHAARGYQRSLYGTLLWGGIHRVETHSRKLPPEFLRLRPADGVQRQPAPSLHTLLDVEVGLTVPYQIDLHINTVSRNCRSLR